MSRGCETLFILKTGGFGDLKGFPNIDSRPKGNFKSRPSINTRFNLEKEINLSFSFKAKSRTATSLSIVKPLKTKITAFGSLKHALAIDKDLSIGFEGVAGSVCSLDKFFGEFVDTTNYNRLYPKSDYDISNFKVVKNKPLIEHVTEVSDNFGVLGFSENENSVFAESLIDIESDAFYEAINEGVFYRDYNEDAKYSEVVFDDKNYIVTNNRAAYASFTLEKPLATIRDSHIIIRANSNASFKIYDIELENKFGNTVAIYPDIAVSGDGEFTTYAFKATTNYAALNTYENDYESIVDPLDLRPTFGGDENFSVLGYLENSNSNSGSLQELGLSTDHNLDVYGFESPKYTQNNDLKIKFKVSVEDTSRYSAFNDFFNDNFDDSDFGNRHLKISSIEVANYQDGAIREENFVPFFVSVPNKGLRRSTCFGPTSTSGNNYLFDIANGVCSESFREGSYSIAFADDFYRKYGCEKNEFWFNADEIYLRAYISGTGNISVSGYMNDGLLNYQAAPFLSGVKTIQESRVQDIPLVFNTDNKSRPVFGDFSLNISKTGTVQISKLEFCISHPPANAIKLETLGGNLVKSCYRDEGKFIVSTMGSLDSPVNKGFGYSKTSLIQNIPHEYGSPATLRSNYSRRWVGIPGNLRKSPFDQGAFGLDYQFEQPNSPFLLGHYTFDSISGGMLNPKVGSPIQIVGNRQVVRNLGLRTKTKSAITDSIHTYDSVDWESGSGVRFSDSYDGTLLPISGFTTGYTYLGSGINNITNGDIILPQSFTNTAPSGFSLYLKFTPAKFNTASPNYIPNRDLLFCSTSGNTLNNFFLYLDKVSKKVIFKHGVSETSIPFNYNGKQFPFHLILTYKEPINIPGLIQPSGDKIRMYGKFDDESVYYQPLPQLDFHISGVSIPSGNKFIVRTGNIYLHELGISSNNIVTFNPSGSKQEESVIRFLDGKSVHWSHVTSSGWVNDNYKLPSFVDTNIKDWDLGDFKFSHFDNSAFSIMKSRPTLEHINFDIKGSGSPYNNNLSYDSQIENDFLRFNFNNPKDNVYGVPVRISKDIMDGYLFENKAIVADTIIDYSQEGEIVWADGKVGPKMIVTLFSNSLGAGESGIINKKEFYLDPYISWEKLECTFDPEDYWGYNKPSLFNQEFTHRILKNNLSDMFVQYDVQIPLSNYFRSKINIHAINVDVKCPIIQNVENVSDVNLFASGNYVNYEFLNLNSIGRRLDSGILSLYTSGHPPITDSVNLYTHTKDGEDYSILTLNSSCGNSDLDNSQLKLTTYAQYKAESNLNFVSFYDYKVFPKDLYLGLWAKSSLMPDVNSSVNIVAYSSTEPELKNINYVNLNTIGRSEDESIYSDAVFNLYVKAPNTPSSFLNLYLEGRDNLNPSASSSTNLHSITHSLVYNGLSGKTHFLWSMDDVGRGVEAIDEDKLSVPSTNEIRDTEGVCYGKCGCTEDYLTTHDINWLGDNCYDGGIARPFKFNKFNDNPFYPEGFFYGARKYTGLIPNSRYNINISVVTGSTDPVELPREFEEWEYGSLGNIDYKPNFVANTGTTGGSLDFPTFDSYDIEGSNEDFDMSNEVPIVSGEPKVIKTLDDKLFVSRPKSTVEGLANAGLISIYKRTELSGSGDKSGLEFSEHITLPVGMVQDFYYELPGKFVARYGEIPKRKWNIGQEGREFGYSMDITKNGDIETLVVGAPKSHWNRQFDEIETSGVNVALLVFTDEYGNYGYDSSSIEELNVLLKYFASHPTKVNIKPIIYHPVGITQQSDFQTFGLVVKTLPRIRYNSQNNESIAEEAFNKIKDGFFEAFPHDENERNNNIPIIVMAYVDNTRSMGRYVVEPAIDRFFDFYKTYSYQSGVVDLNNNPREGYVFEKVIQNDRGEDHKEISKEFIQEILSTGNLFSTGAFNLFTEGIGPEYANSENIEFNIPPESGGRVYVFENEYNSWSLIQEISLDSDPYNMFGHSVSISKDAKTIAIGSPHAKENCIILKRKENSKELVYNSVGRWLEANNRIEFDLYKDILEVSGVTIAGKEIYKNLTDKERFYIRSDEKVWGINKVLEFEKVITDGVDGIGGEFTEIPSSNAGNPRLGFSSVVNDDGSVVVFGAPTDSLGLYANADFYFKNDGYHDPENPDLELVPKGTWNSYVNAGSIRVYDQARKTIPTSKTVLEYGRFGNLSRAIAFKSYDTIGNEQNATAISKNPNYKETRFDEFKIPDDTPAIFIVTPEVDATNQEVMSEIKRWMSLGDRRLVLVGDDPVWEYGGAFRRSNDIINKILEKLDSKMRLVPARNEAEALIKNNKFGDQLPINVIESFKPDGSRSTTIKHNSSLNAYGVADIKFYAPRTNFTSYSEYKLENNIKRSIASDYNKGCKLSISNYGDLRAEWTERGLKFPPEQEDHKKYVYWKRNLPFEYNSAGGARLSEQDTNELNRSRNINIPGAEPSPLMVAAEFKEKTIVIPGSPPTSSEYPIYEKVCTSKNTITYNFADDPEDSSICWSSEKSDYLELDYNYYILPPEGINPLFNPEVFYDRDGVIQGRSINLEGGTKIGGELKTLDPNSNVIAREDIGTSSVYLIASVDMEENNMIDNEDQNISFYDNLVRIGSVYNSRIAQIGGWTGATSFNSFVPSSLLKNIFTARGHDVYENWNTPLSDTRNVAWISNTPNLPNDLEVQNIKEWLASGGKKLVITYDKTQERATNVYNLCELLGLNIKPWKLPDGKMAKNNRAINKVVLGFGPEILSYVDRDRVNKLAFELDFVPIQIVSGVYIVQQEAPITFLYSSTSQDPDTVKMRTGVSRVRFPAIAGSGYEITYRWYSDFENEVKPLEIYMANVSIIADNPEELNIKNTIPVVNYDLEDKEVPITAASYKYTLNSPLTNIVYENKVDVQISSDYLDIFITGNKKDPIDSLIEDLHTCKLLDIVIKPLAINQYLSTKTECNDKIVGYGVNFSSGTNDQIVTLQPKLRAISTECLSGDLVEDGPVVIAEELESFSKFEYGSRRSSIVLISDSTLINGRNEKQVEGSIPEQNVPKINPQDQNARINNFINSLLENDSNSSPNIEYRPYTRLVSTELTGGVYGLGLGGGSGVVDPSLYVKEYDYKQEFIIPHNYPEEDREEALERVKDEFIDNISEVGISTKLTLNGHEDIPWSGVGSMTHGLMKTEGKDFLDKEFMFGSYLGELFGYSLSINNNKIFAGSPFNGWANGQIDIGPSGGAGAVFVVEKTPVSGWIISDKIKPTTAFPGDRFGYDISSASDLITISSPAHDYGIYIEYRKGGFVRKEFTSEFDIGTRKARDINETITPLPSGESVSFGGENSSTLGFEEYGGSFSQSAESFDSVIDSGYNIGAVYTYQNKVTDFNNRVKTLTFVEKIATSGTELLGEKVHIYRNHRSDSDYGLAILENSGVYLYDGMIRKQPKSLVSPDAEFNAFVFGGYNKFSTINFETGDNLDYDLFNQDFTVSTQIRNTIKIELNNLDGLNSVLFNASGSIYSDAHGQVFLEISGVDTSKLGFVSQRPYISKILGRIDSTDSIFNSIDFYTNASALVSNDNLNLYTLAPNSHWVYNSLDLVTKANVSGDIAGSLNVFSEAYDPSILLGYLDFYTDNVGLEDNSLNLRVRGK